MKKTKVVIHHVSNNGFKHIKVVEALNVSLDWGHQLDGVVIPAIRLDTNAAPYFLTGVHNMKEVSHNLKEALSNEMFCDILVPIDVFDPILDGHYKDVSQPLRKYVVEMVNVFGRTHAFANFSTHDLNLLCKGNMKPIFWKNQERLVELWRATLPLPKNQKNISKKTFFTKIIQNV